MCEQHETRPPPGHDCASQVRGLEWNLNQKLIQFQPGLPLEAPNKPLCLPRLPLPPWSGPAHPAARFGPAQVGTNLGIHHSCPHRGPMEEQGDSSGGVQLSLGRVRGQVMGGNLAKWRGGWVERVVLSSTSSAADVPTGHGEQQVTATTGEP